MWQIVRTVVLVSVVALSIASGAAAKSGVELSSIPTNLGPGDPWLVDVRVYGDVGARAQSTPPPVVRIRNDEAGVVRTFRSTRIPGTVGVFEVTIRFPEEGLWQYGVRYGGRLYEYDPIVIETPVAAPVSGSQGGDPQPGPALGTDDGGFPLWPVVAGSLAAALLGALGIARLRGRRLAPWPAAPSSARTASRGR